MIRVILHNGESRDFSDAHYKTEVVVEGEVRKLKIVSTVSNSAVSTFDMSQVKLILNQ